MTKRSKPKPRRRGRPTRGEASAKALAGVDLRDVDPRTILKLIAADKSAPATARVAACRALLGKGDDDPGDTAGEDDAVTRLAVQLLRGKRK